MKAAYPNLTTVATLNWPSMPADMPVDVRTENVYCCVWRLKQPAFLFCCPSFKTCRDVTQGLGSAIPNARSGGCAELDIDREDTMAVRLNQRVRTLCRSRSSLHELPATSRSLSLPFDRYHCISPSSLTYLNTFIERPGLQDRLLFWLAAKNEVEVGAPNGSVHVPYLLSWLPCCCREHGHLPVAFHAFLFSVHPAGCTMPWIFGGHAMPLHVGGRLFPR